MTAEPRRTKIVATIGPATPSTESIGRLIDAGMDAARLNMSHGTQDEHAERARMLREAEGASGRPIALIADLQGPKLRVGELAEPIVLERDASIVIAGEDVAQEGDIPVSPSVLGSVLHPGVDVLIDDGSVRLRVERVERARDRAYLNINIDEARRRDHMRALGKLSTRVPGGGWLIRDRPPLLLRLPDDDPGRAALPALYAAYLRTLAPDRRILVEKHRLLDVALKVVGVGSVGTRCYVALFAGPAGGPLILQVKEAGQSVLAPYVPGRRQGHQGERVVNGQRIMQAVSDSFLGWTRSPASGTEYYVRQLHDMKYGIDIAGLRPAGMRLYAEVCAWALARAHARSGNPAEIAGYLGAGDIFDEAIADFAVRYADQTERDHAALAAAVRMGRLAGETGV